MLVMFSVLKWKKWAPFDKVVFAYIAFFVVVNKTWNIILFIGYIFLKGRPLTLKALYILVLLMLPTFLFQKSFIGDILLVNLF